MKNETKKHFFLLTQQVRVIYVPDFRGKFDTDKKIFSGQIAFDVKSKNLTFTGQDGASHTTEVNILLLDVETLDVLLAFGKTGMRSSTLVFLLKSIICFFFTVLTARSLFPKKCAPKMLNAYKVQNRTIFNTNILLNFVI